MITSLIYLGIFQIIFHNTIDPLPVAIKKPILKCTEGMLRRIFSKRPTTWALNGLFLPIISQLFLKNQYTFCLTLFLFHCTKLFKNLWSKFEVKRICHFDTQINWDQNGLFYSKLEFLSEKVTAFVYFVYWSPSLHEI